MVEYAENREEADAFARTALGMMAKHEVPPTPRNFTIWYTYASGTNPDLKAAIDTLVQRRESFDAGQNETLYERYFGYAEEGEAVEAAGNDIQQSIREVMEMLHSATDGAQNYGQNLERNVRALNENSSMQDLQRVVASVVSETKGMVAQNRRLESELKKSSTEIEGLRQRLEDVRKESMTDGLTGIANRKHFDLTLRKAATAAEAGGSLCLILTDIDHFKRFNDSYGHQTGDIVLKLVAKTLTQNIKGRDTAARYGGEEFAVILPDTDLSDARIVAEQIRQSVASKRLRKKQTGEDLGNITLSLGVAKYRPGESLTELIQRADEGLYFGKAHGRNQVVLETQLADHAAD